MTERTVRWAGVAAIIFVVLILITVFSGGQPPDADAAVDKIRTFLIDNRSTLLLSNLLGLIGIPFVVWFVVVLRDVLRGDRTSNALGTASLAGLVVTAPMAMVGGALSVAPVYVSGVANHLGDDTIRIMFEAQNLMFAATSAGIVLFSITTALAIRRTKALPTYTMWLAFVATLGAGAAGLGVFGILSFALFLLVTGITMAAGKTTPATSIA